jgi:NADH-quinone oxidoreductase subunit G
MEWQLLIEIGRRLGLDLPHLTPGMVLGEIAERVPFYAGVTLDEIGGDGIRWPEREASKPAATALGELRFAVPADPPATPHPANGALRLAVAPNLWASWETDRAPALRFLRATQTLHLNPADAERIGVGEGEQVEVRSNGHVVHAEARLLSRAPAGTVTLLLGTAQENANVLVNGGPALVEVRGQR